MAFYCQNMLEIALILADHDPAYEEQAFKFLETFIWISYAMDKAGEHRDDMWDEQDGFYYDVPAAAGRRGLPAEGALDGRAPARCAPARCSRRTRSRATRGSWS